MMLQGACPGTPNHRNVADVGRFATERTTLSGRGIRSNDLTQTIPNG